jgi:tRNA-splicing ligase RtcB
MPDIHLARDVCIGTVLATTRLIYPAAVGGDIGCGIAAAAFDLPADALRDPGRATELLERLRQLVPSIRHETRTTRPLPAALAGSALSDRRLDAILRRDGAIQFGTLGRGNHFLEFQADEEDRLWIMIHSGSRAIGQAIRDLHVAGATSASRGMASLEAASLQGRSYLSDAEWARRYACANRRAMVEASASAISKLFHGKIDDASYFDCDHNHVRLETHGGRSLWVHRKGANSAAMGERGIIPGSMGTESYHVEGRGNAESFCSSSHGAGRAMSREAARRRISENDVRRQMGQTFFESSAAAELREEAPGAYKDIRPVFRAQADLVKRVRRLRPLLVYKG